MFKEYSNPEATGWLGWFEDSDGNTTAFVGLDKYVVFMSDLNFK
jgi:hypothetical protein